MQDSIFTKIINGEIPSHKIYEDEKTYAFLDIHPKTPGHTLVVPKKQVEFVWDLDVEDYIAVMETAKKVANRMREVLDTRYVGEAVVGDEVPHAHVHVYPFSTKAEVQSFPDPNGEVDNDALAEMAKKLAF